MGWRRSWSIWPSKSCASPGRNGAGDTDGLRGTLGGAGKGGRMTRFRGVSHLALVTNDMERTVRFYRDVLGMRLVGTTGNRNEDYPYRHYFFSLGPGTTIAFFEWPDATLPARKDSGVPASGILFDHVAI